MAAATTTIGEIQELWVFDADELVEDLIQLNEKLKDTLRADLIGLTLFLKSARQSVQQIKLLGLMGRAYHKVGRNGRRYIIFKGIPAHAPIFAEHDILRRLPKLHASSLEGVKSFGMHLRQQR